MTTVLVLVLDEPTAALEDNDPTGWTAGYVRAQLLAAGLVVHDCASRPELLLGVPAPEGRPTGASEPEQHRCPIPWCQALPFSRAHYLTMHMRSHTEVACPHCGDTFKLTGMHSHERHCTENPNRVVPEAKRPEATNRRHATRPPRPARPPAPEPPKVKPIGDLGPIARRPFDPDQVRAGAMGSASW